jgi:hypothetical protein
MNFDSFNSVDQLLQLQVNLVNLTVKISAALLYQASSYTQCICAPFKFNLQRQFANHFISRFAIFVIQRLLVDDSAVNLAIKLLLSVFFTLLSSHILL